LKINDVEVRFIWKEQLKDLGNFHSGEFPNEDALL